MNRFLVCLFPTLLFWSTPIVTVLPLLEARPVHVAPTESQQHKNEHTSDAPGDPYPTDLGVLPTTSGSEYPCVGDLDCFNIGNVTSGNSSVTESTSESKSDSNSDHDVPMQVMVISSIVLGLYSIVGTVGNGLVILAFCMYRQVRTSAHTFIVSISVSDILITGLQYPTGIASMIIGAPSLGEAMCPILGATLFFSIYVSLFSVLLIAFNRCTHITKSPNTYQSLFAPLRSFLWVVLSWVVSALLVTPGFLGYGEFGWGAEHRKCGMTDGNAYNKHYVSNIYALSYLIVFCLVAGVYLRIYFYVKDSVVTMAAANLNLANPEQYVSARVIKQTKHMFIIFTVFTVTSAPFVLLGSIDSHLPFMPREVSFVLIGMYCLNHVLNPFLYAWKLPVFRRAFKAIIRCKRHLPFQPGAAAI
ncbi:PREDICTED: melatonin receptor type 1B-A-like [Branchiostoma belcheri]|uniref:Melatonin receptor type 1B-A-like n=1 Tax=Branchiostoma belcheri TaxID=7741 RepID=A0A6P5A4J4_BRABE|nr:PREDICTED: melatonin receptor type 1B-A-like [Branchiostoma belcheri]